MSFNDEGEGFNQAKKRRVQRACSLCRTKKIRCDGNERSDGTCSTCTKYDTKCTYEGPSIPRNRGNLKEYIQQLESRLEKLSKLFLHLHPGIDLDSILHYDDSIILTMDPASFFQLAVSPAPQAQPSKPNGEIISAFLCVSSQLVEADDDQEADGLDLSLLDDFRRLSMQSSDEKLFFGKSSSMALLQTAIDLKREMHGIPKDDGTSTAPSFGPRILASRRQEFWSVPSWELALLRHTHPPGAYTFPEDDLLPILVDLYFEHFNAYSPVLHRPTFERAIKDGLHLTHDTFGAIVLLVCAIGSRHSNDPRVRLEGSDNMEQSCGWRYFAQVQIVRASLLYSPSLYDLQFYCLAIEFLRGSSANHSCWILIGIAIRLAQEVGVHKWKRKTHPVSVENELWKRVFWVLVNMDRVLGSLLGRPCAISNEDLDLDLPLEVDDEYWEHPDPEQAFKQPEGKPSTVTAFNHTLKLMNILGTTLRILYCTSKSRLALGLVGEWQQPFVAQLDSSLNQWVDSLPDHLRWDPNRDDDIFFRQSATLYCQYYYVRIVIHRPFLHTESSLALSSMVVCANAARSCSHVVDMQCKKAPSPFMPIAVLAAFISGVVLLLNLWTSKRSGLPTNQEKDMADVHRCMDVHRRCEDRWPVSGRIWDILNELAHVGELALPPLRSLNQPKRERDTDGAKPVSVPSADPLTLSQPAASFDESALDFSWQPSRLPISLEDLANFAMRPNPSDFSYPLGHENTTAVNGIYEQLPVSDHSQSVSLHSWPPATTSSSVTVNSLAADPTAMASQPLLDGNTLDMWMNTPMSFDLEDWGRYLANVDDITRSTHPSSSHT